MEAAVRALFERYEREFNAAVSGKADLDAIRSFYADDFIAASPHGVNVGRNDDALKDVMKRGYARYRAIGTKRFHVRDVEVVPIDELHGLAKVSWRSVYSVDGKPDVTIDFTNAYLVRIRGGEQKIFGWILGDEQALLREHGIG